MPGELFRIERLEASASFGRSERHAKIIEGPVAGD